MPTDECAHVSPEDVNFRWCNQDLLRSVDYQSFPFTSARQPQSKQWMTDEQEDLTDSYGKASLVVVAVVCLLFLYRMFVHFQSKLVSSYDVSVVLSRQHAHN